MFFVELVMQGVRGFRELLRLRFQSGFNLITAGNEAGKTTAVDILERLLFPRGQDGAMNLFVSRHTPDASRGALVVCSDDGTYYRVIQDFAKRAVNLSRYNAGSKEFSLMHKDWDSASQFMDGITAGVSEEDYARVFVLRRDQSPEQTAPVVRPAPARHSAPAVAPKSSPNQARLAELRETLRKAEEAADADYRYQSAKLALDEIKKKQNALGDSNKKKAELETTLEGLKGCETLPENLNELLEAHEQHQGRKLADTEELNKELEGLKLRLASIPSVNLLTDKLFIIGAAFGILSIIAGVFILTAEYSLYFQLGILLSVVMMVVAWYNGTRKSVQRRTVRKDLETVEKELLDLERKSVHEGAAITAAMRSVNAAGPGELKEKAENYRYFSTLLKDNIEGQQRFLGDVTPEALQQQFEKQQAEVLALEQAAKAMAQYAIDTYSIRQDIERLESEASPAAPAWDMGGIDHDLPSDFAMPVHTGGVLAELTIAARIGGIELETLIPAVESAAQRNLSAATGGRYVRIELGQDGSPVVHGKDDSIIVVSELSHGTKALIHFCVRAGIVEALAGKRRLPFIIDDALAGFDPGRQQAACQLLRALGTKTQVLLFTSNPALKAAGDVATELK
jgi:hypothetical protein